MERLMDNVKLGLKFHCGSKNDFDHKAKHLLNFLQTDFK